ncbi:hypothetical protein GWN26_00875, partial [Candidatus Saccharibacteria bacterium]|nr:hypothetical protein [Calditrichia bacterium]NIV97767.1 hypothetical protein [Candidatus Saccharibacteria bacterium]
HLIDYVLIFPFWLGLILVVEVLPYFLTLEIVNAVVKFIPSISIPNWQTVRATLLIAIVALFAVYIGIRTYLDTYRVRLQAYQVELNNLPSTLENLSLSFFSDIQVDKFTQERKLSQFEKKLKASNSELMLFAGDLVT